MDRDVYLGMGAAVNRDYKLISAGKNTGMGLTEDFFVDMNENPYEKKKQQTSAPEEEARLKDFITQYDTITPYQKELPYGYGKKGFKAPKEWRVTKP